MRIPPIPGPAAGLSAALRAAACPAQAQILQRFFKTGPGQYAEGDRFLGVKVPVIRKLVRQFRGLSPAAAQRLVHSPLHEERLAGLLVWVDLFDRGDATQRAALTRRYLANLRHVNNWDLVDLSAPHLLGRAMDPGRPGLLFRLARSRTLWDRRIAVVATLAFIRRGCLAPTFELCERLMADPHDLMHKACGWMLREAGKRDRAALSAFLERHAPTLPRTMLRYALEHYPAADRARHMAARRGPGQVPAPPGA